MKLLLTKEDLEQVIRAHVAGLFTLSAEAKMEIEIGNGQVEIDINYMTVTRIPGIVAANKAAATTPVASLAPVEAEFVPTEAARAVDTTVPQKGLTASGKPDLRTAEGRALKAKMDAEEAAKASGTTTQASARKSGLFSQVPTKPTADPEPSQEEIDAANRAAEAAEIVAETDIPVDGQEADEGQEQEEATNTVAETPAPPPAATTPRKSLFS